MGARTIGAVAGATLLFVGASGHGTERSAALEAALGARRLVAARIEGTPPVVDGRMDETVWNEAEPASDFVQTRPQPGVLATLPTEARVLFDDEALYVGVRLSDPEPRTITAPYPRRDDETLSDWVFVEIDSRRDRRTAFSFGLNPRGVQVDGCFLNDVSYDIAWNAVWEGASRIDASGWTAEYRIPFSQLVYSVDGVGSGQDLAPGLFGFNVYRYNPRRGESSNWSPRLPWLSRVVSAFNELALQVPRRAARFELSPFVSARAQSPGSGPSGGASSATGGLDVRAALGPAFTLTAALRPDFGQVEADPSEVNLTTFETLLTERRPFFVENAGLFAFALGLPFTTRGVSFAAEQAFYSRRIGRPPRLSAAAGAGAPADAEGAPLEGALEVTGRTAGGWSFGGLGAVTGSRSTRVADGFGLSTPLKLEPWTAFGVARASKDFRRGASAIGAIATMVERSGMTSALEAVLAGRSIAAGLDARHRFGGDRYEATGFVFGGRTEGAPAAIASVLQGPGHYTQRPDASHLGDGDDVNATTAAGVAGQVRLARIGGEHWRWALVGHALSPRLDVNDVGFQRNADWLIATASLSYQHDRPGRVLRRWSIGSNQIGAGWSFAGERRATVINLNANADLNSYWGGSLSVDHELADLQTETLRGGPALLTPPRTSLGLSVYSDTRRLWQVAVNARAARDSGIDGRRLTVAPALSLRPSDRLALSLSPSLDWTTNPWQYVGTAVAGGQPHYVLGRLDQKTVSLTARVDFAFSPRLTLQLYAQPFAGAGDFDDYKEVVAPRAPRVEDRTKRLDALVTLNDPTYHARELRANLVLRYEYRPGSTLFVVWTQDRDAATTEPFGSAAREVVAPFGGKPRNVLLLKLSYWFAPRR